MAVNAGVKLGTLQTLAELYDLDQLLLGERISSVLDSDILNGIY